MHRDRFTFRCLAQLIESVGALSEMFILSRSDKITVFPGFRPSSGIPKRM